MANRPVRILVNKPIFDKECWFFNSKQGCRYGYQCYYKHLTTDKPTTHQTIIGYQNKTIYLLQNIYDMLKSIIDQKTITTAKPPNPPKPTHTSKSSNTSNTLNLSSSNEVKLNVNETKTEAKSSPGFSLLDLKSNSPTPIPTIKPIQVKSKAAKAELYLAAMGRSPSPAPNLAAKVDETPTGLYFESTHQKPKVISTDNDKRKFFSWIIKQVVIDQFVLEPSYLSSVTSGLCGDINYDITTGHQAVLYIYNVLEWMNVKYRKLFDCKKDI